MMLDAALREQLAANGLFYRIDFEEIDHLLRECSQRQLADEEALLSPGEGNDTLFVVLRGELKVYLGDGELLPLTVLGVGECAGEMSLLDGQGVSALVVASGECELLGIPRDTLWALIDRSHAFARNLLSVLAGRMRRDNLALVTTTARSLEFEQAASVDSLTGLHNRRWMLDAYERTLRRCRQDGVPLCLLLADVDDFRMINELHGHRAGDAVLHAVAQRLAECLRAQDLIARCGAEEFAILLPQTSVDEALCIAERLRLAVSERLVDGEQRWPPFSDVGVSCGLTALRDDDDLDSLLSRAQVAVAAARQEGHGRIDIAA